jgi:4-carboxymuconolactone decarboxylase
MPPRIPLPDPLDEAQLAELAKAPHTPSGAPLNLFATLAHDPRLLRRVNALGGYFPTRGHLDGRTRELAILRTAGTFGCDYELLHHRALGERLGLTADEVAALVAGDGGAEVHPWSATDRALLDCIDELLARHTVSEARWVALDGILDDLQRLELLMIVGFYAMLAGMLNAVGVELDAEPLAGL